MFKIGDFVINIKNINETYIENEKEREHIYKEALSSRDPQKLVGIIKTLSSQTGTLRSRKEKYLRG